MIHPVQPLAQRPLLLILLLAAVLRLAAVLAYPHTPESDEIAYINIAKNVLDRGEIVDGIGNRAFYNVGYPLLVLLPAFSLFGENYLPVKLIHVLLGLLSTWLAARIACAAGGNARAQALSALVVAAYLPYSVYSVYLFKENLMVPLMLLLLLYTLRLSQRVRLADALVAGLTLGVMALVGNSGLSLAAATAMALALSPGKLDTKLKLLALVCIAALLVCGPWLLRNWRVFGEPILNTNGPFNLYLGNNPNATGWFVSISDTPRAVGWEALRQADEYGAMKSLGVDARAWIVGHPLDFVNLTLKKAVYFWLPPVHDGKYAMGLAEQMVRKVWLLQYLALMAAAVFAFARRLRPTRAEVVLMVALLAYFAAHTLFYINFRYREPIIACLGLLLALRLERLFPAHAARLRN